VSTVDRERRRVELAVHAFPPRWHRHSGQALVETTLELHADRDGHVPLRTLIDIVRSGLSERRRDRPSIGKRLQLSFPTGDIPPRWVDWWSDRVRSPLFIVRFIVGRSFGAWGLPAFSTLLWILHPVPGGQNALTSPLLLLFDASVMVLATFVAIARRSKMRVTQLRRAGVTSEGSFAPTIRRPIFVPFSPPTATASFAAWPILTAAGWLALLGGAAFITGAAFPKPTVRIFGFEYATDGNSPVTARHAAMIGLAALAIGIALAAFLRRRPATIVEARPALNARSRRAQQIFVSSIVMSSFAATWLGLASVFPDLASAIGGAMGLAASPTLIIGATRAHRTGATIDDLLRNARGDYRQIRHPIR
jgi:hypothetical protein